MRDLQLSQAAQDEFGKFASIQVLSHAELFGGKICAALDRQHPRDLFDVRALLANEGLSDEVRRGFIAALLGHDRPIHEVINSNFENARHVFDTQFAGMALQPFDYSDYETTREALATQLQESLTDDERNFIIGFKTGEPDWGLFPAANLQYLPSVRWKLANIRKLKANNPTKHARQLERLKAALSD